MYQYLKEGCKEDRVRFLSLLPSDRPSDNGLPLKQKFILNVSKGFVFTLKVVELKSMLPREVMESLWRYSEYLFGDIQNVTRHSLEQGLQMLSISRHLFQLQLFCRLLLLSTSSKCQYYYYSSRLPFLRSSSDNCPENKDLLRIK